MDRGVAELKKKTILVIGGGLEAVEGVRQLQEDGFFVVVCDGNDKAPCFELADAAIVASIYHAEQCVPAVSDYHRSVRAIDGLIVLACDAPHVGARVCKEIGISGLEVAVADRMVNKLEMKEYLQAGNVCVPDFAAVQSVDQTRAYLHQWGKIVVKPVDSRGSKGVSILDEGGDADWAFGHALEFSPTQSVMVERFISGLQLSTEGLVVDGKAYTTGFADRNYELLEKFAPFVIENGGALPTCLPGETVQEICAILDQAAAALGIYSGPLKGDLVVDEDGKVYIIELAARLSGGHFCTFDIPYSTGVYLVPMAARLAVGLPVSEQDLTPKHEKQVCIRLLFPDQEGVIERVSGVERASNGHGVLKTIVWAKAGDECRLPTNSGGSLGVVIATGATRSDAQQNAEVAVGLIELDVR